MEKQNFVTFFDNKIVDIFLMHIMSLHDVYGNDEYVYYVGTDKKTIQLKDTVFKDFNIVFYDVEKEKDFLRKNNFIHNGNTEYTFMRIIITNIFKNLNNESFVYVDPDSIFNNKLDFKDGHNYVISVKNNIFEKWIKWSYWRGRLKSQEISKNIKKQIMEDRYFNAGVLIVNDIDEYNKISESIIKGKEREDDQTLLNHYNETLHSFKLSNNFKNNATLRELSRTNNLDHFAGIKPWYAKWYNPIFKARHRRTNWKHYYYSAQEKLKK